MHRPPILLLSGLVSLSSCLYVGGINHAPEVETEVVVKTAFAGGSDEIPLELSGAGAVVRPWWAPGCGGQRRCYAEGTGGADLGGTCAVDDDCAPHRYCDRSTGRCALRRPLVAVEIEAVAVDEDDDALSYSWSGQLVAADDSRYHLVRAEAGEPLLLERAERGDGATVDALPSLGETRTLQVRLPLAPLLEGQRTLSHAAGSYRFVVVARDDQGATGTAEVQLELTNRAPEVAIELLEDPRGGGSDYYREEPLRFTVVTSGDDDDRRCGRGSTVAWELLAPAASAREEVLGCEGHAILDKLLVQLEPDDAPTDVTVRATIRDRWGASAAAERTVTVAATQTPCITGTTPTFDAGKVLVDYDPGADTLGTFSVGHLARPYAQPSALRYRWLVAEQSDGPFAALPVQEGASLALPRSTLLPGERVFLRVVVSDSEAGLDEVGCAEEEPLCRDAADLPAACYQWITWEVEAR